MALLDPELAATIECRLVTTGRRTGEPREVRIWFASAGERLFLLSQDRDRAQWVRNIAADNRVRVRIGGRTFEGRAAVIPDGVPEDALARDAWANKYGSGRFEKFLRDALPVAIEVEREVT